MFYEVYKYPAIGSFHLYFLSRTCGLRFLGAVRIPCLKSCANAGMQNLRNGLRWKMWSGCWKQLIQAKEVGWFPKTRVRVASALALLVVRDIWMQATSSISFLFHLLVSVRRDLLEREHWFNLIWFEECMTLCYSFEFPFCHILTCKTFSGVMAYASLLW